MRSHTLVIAGSLALAAAWLTASPAQAQTCLGMASYTAAPFRAATNGAFSDDVSRLSTNFSYGRRGFFGGVGVGLTSFDQLDGSGVAIGTAGGYETAVDRERKVRLCPVASFGFLSGPNNILGSGTDYSETDFAFGVSVGMTASRTAELRIIPTAGLAFNVAHGTFESDTGGKVSDTETFVVLDLGVGFVFNRVVSLRPLIGIPIGLPGGDPSFGVTVGLNFGGRR